MIWLLAQLLALFLTGQADEITEDSWYVPAMIGLSQSALEAECRCDTEGVFEVYDKTIWIGAIAEDTEISFGFSVPFSPDGQVVFERSEP